jgi:serine/tyrosine/threonine adenylyltransferase
LLSALAPIIGAEKVKGEAVTSQWGVDISESKLKALTASGLSIQPEMEKLIISEFQTEYNRLMRKVRSIPLVMCAVLTVRVCLQRLGLRLQKEDDYREIISPLLNILERWELDYSTTLRTLARFQPELLQEARTADLGKLLDDMNTTSQCANPKATGGDSSAQDWTKWLNKFAIRIEEERDEWISPTEGPGEWYTRRRKEIIGANPRFILRQWILEEVIAKVEADPVSGRTILAKVLEVSIIDNCVS